MKLFKLLYVYILKCKDGSYYTGVTNNLDRRVSEHNTGIDTRCYTYKKRPVQVVYADAFQDFRQAIAWEKQIKGWSRKKKEALIEQNWSRLPDLSKCLNATSHVNYKGKQ